MHSILSLPQQLFAEFPIVACGTLIDPLFTADSISAYTDRGVNSDVLCNDAGCIHELTLYNHLSSCSDEFATKLFCYVVERLNWCRLMTAQEIDNHMRGSSIAADLRMCVRRATLMLRKYCMQMSVDEETELSNLLSRQLIL